MSFKKIHSCHPSGNELNARACRLHTYSHIMELGRCHTLYFRWKLHVRQDRPELMIGVRVASLYIGRNGYLNGKILLSRKELNLLIKMEYKE